MPGSPIQALSSLAFDQRPDDGHAAWRFSRLQKRKN